MKLTRALILSVLIIGIGWPQQSRAEPITFAIIFAGAAILTAAAIISDNADENADEMKRHAEQQTEELRQQNEEIKQELESTSLWGIAGLIVSLAGVFFAGLQAFRQRKKKR